MPGNSGKVGLVLQERDRLVLSLVEKLRIASREQIARAIGFTSVRRANARLLKLTSSGLLRRSFIGSVGSGRRALYLLPRDRSRKSPNFLEHQLLLNDFYLLLSAGSHPKLTSWRTFARPLHPSLPLIPDALARFAGDAHPPAFIEVDRGTESGRVWREKARHYVELALSDAVEQVCEKPFRVLVLAPSDRRVRYIRQAVGSVTSRLFWFSTFDILRSGDFFGSDWLRPAGEKKVPLI